MKCRLLFVFFLVAISASAQAPVITQTTPVVNQGKTLQFTETLSEPGTWSCAGSCAGSITSGGLYTAPATVTPQASYGGFQLFPNNHIYNTRVDALAVDAHSAAWIAGAGSSTFAIFLEPLFPINYCNGSTPSTSMQFLDTPANNGNFQLTSYPNARIQGGWFTRARGSTIDHHWVCIDTTNGTFQELFDVVPLLPIATASVTSNVGTFTFASDPTRLGYYAGRSFAVGGYTGADTYFNAPGSSWTISTITTSAITFPITHANAVASSTGSLGIFGNCPSAGLITCNAESGIRYLNSTYGLPNAQGGSTDAAGLYIAPLILRLQEMEQAVAHGTPINHALRMTLQNGFICGSSVANACGNNAVGTRHIWPATAEAFSGGGIIPYGARFRLKASYNISGFSSTAQIILTTLKNYGLILSDGGTGWLSSQEVAPWPASILAALKEVSDANIAPSNFEAVDESALMISSTSGETTNNRETVTFTRTSDSMTASVDVALMGVAVGLPNDILNIQAGTPAQQLTAFVSGGANNTVTWTVSPAITGGSLTSSGLLTPPATIAAVTAYTVTATSTDNGAIAASMTVWIFPTGPISIRPGATTPYTDTNGHVWAPSIQGSPGGWTPPPFGDLSGGPWPVVADIAEYYYAAAEFFDNYFNFSVPNGTYRITLKFGTDHAAGQRIDDIESPSGTLVYTNVDINTLAGGTYLPADLVTTQTVTTGTLSLVIRLPSSAAGSSINAIEIANITPGTTLTPHMTGTPGMTVK